MRDKPPAEVVYLFFRIRAYLQRHITIEKLLQTPTSTSRHLCSFGTLLDSLLPGEPAVTTDPSLSHVGVHLDHCCLADI